MLGGIIKEVENYLSENSPQAATQSLPDGGNFERTVDYGLSIKDKTIQKDEKIFILAYQLTLSFFSPSRDVQLGAGDIQFSCIKDPEDEKRDFGLKLGNEARDIIYSGIERLSSENPEIQYKIRRPAKRNEFATRQNRFFIRMKGSIENFISEEEFPTEENFREVERLENHLLQQPHLRQRRSQSFRQSSNQG